MTQIAKDLANELLARLRANQAKGASGRPKDYLMSYGDLCAKANKPSYTRSAGRYLGELANECASNGWPLLNALAVNRKRGKPGDNYNGPGGGSLATWPSEVAKVAVFRGYPARF